MSYTILYNTNIYYTILYYKVEMGVLHTFAYRVEGTHEDLLVSTTRLETLFGDTAIAVHSQDPRYSHLHGKFVRQPVTGRRVPIILDDILVDPTLGTGAVKVTPAHDAADYACGLRHGLDMLNVIHDDGTLNSHCMHYQGMDRYVARAQLVADLKGQGVLREEKSHAMSLARCSRSGDILEPLIKAQWFVSMADMAKQASDRAKTGELCLKPEQHHATWYRWLKGWCCVRLRQCAS